MDKLLNLSAKGGILIGDVIVISMELASLCFVLMIRIARHPSAWLEVGLILDLHQDLAMGEQRCEVNFPIGITDHPFGCLTGGIFMTIHRPSPYIMDEIFLCMGYEDVLLIVVFFSLAQQLGKIGRWLLS